MDAPKNLRLGLIGCGSIGRIHASCVATIPGARFTAYADVRVQAAEKALAEFGGDYATDDPGRIFADATVDAVYVCTLHDTHAPLAIAAARAGKHVLVEKPLALNLTDCRAVAAAVEKAGVFLMPAFKMRYYPLIRQAHEFIARPQVVVGQMMDNRWADDAWAQDPVKGGANVFSQGCHTTDILRYLSGGEPRRIWAVGGAMTHPGHSCIDQCIAAIEFDNGAVGSWVQGDAALPPHTSKFFFQMFGGGRSVQLYNRCKTATFYDGTRTWVEERDEEEGFQLENEEFIAALREGRAPAQGVHDGVQATRIVLAADRAIRTGQVQDLQETGGPS